MSPQLVTELARQAMQTTLMLAAPLLAVALIIGLVVSVFQAMTQIQEQTLAFVPKLFAVSAAVLLALPWMLRVLVQYTIELFHRIPAITS